MKYLQAVLHHPNLIVLQISRSILNWQANCLGLLSPPSFWGRLNECQSWACKVTAGCGRVSGLPSTTLGLAPLSAQDNLERR